jgi:tetratricopeptide (TPR) repeat protein
MGRLEEALALLKKTEALYLELGNKDGLQRTYGSQALILQAWGRLEEALALHKKAEALCLELGNKAGSAIVIGNGVC